MYMFELIVGDTCLLSHVTFTLVNFVYLFLDVTADVIGN